VIFTHPYFGQSSAEPSDVFWKNGEKGDFMAFSGTDADPEPVALRFLNALRSKDAAEMELCLGHRFQDVLPEGKLVQSKRQLMELHKQFITSNRTGFRPFDRSTLGATLQQSRDRKFTAEDLDFAEGDGKLGFFRVAAEVDRPERFGESDSPIVRRYMYLGIVVLGDQVVHIQNTLFDPSTVSITAP
jgi:hypothetical protein